MLQTCGEEKVLFRYVVIIRQQHGRMGTRTIVPALNDYPPDPPGSTCRSTIILGYVAFHVFAKKSVTANEVIMKVGAPFPFLPLEVVNIKLAYERLVMNVSEVSGHYSFLECLPVMQLETVAIGHPGYNMIKALGRGILEDVIELEWKPFVVATIPPSLLSRGRLWYYILTRASTIIICDGRHGVCSSRGGRSILFLDPRGFKTESSY
jgi:hypothetical protein